jgi:hypothetical protein
VTQQELDTRTLRDAEPQAALLAELTGQRPVYLHASVAVDHCPWDRLLSLDWSVAGVYRVLVPLDAGDAKAANCALEAFFLTVALEVAHFKFTVYDAMSGAQLALHPEAPSHDLVARTSTAQLLGHLG